MNPLWYIILCCFCNYISYPIVKLLLNWKYPNFKPYSEKRQNYIIKNYIKHYVLKYISISTFPFTILLIFNIGDQSNYIHFIGALYACCDTVALFKNIQLSKSTKIHHTITTFLSIVNTTITWSDTTSIMKLLAVYTIFSCYSYDVNYCLGMRFLLNTEQQSVIKKNALYTYLLTCFINWSIHLFYFITYFTSLYFTGIVYFSLITFIAYDDIILLKWLSR